MNKPELKICLVFAIGIFMAMLYGVSAAYLAISLPVPAVCQVIIFVTAIFGMFACLMLVYKKYLK